MAGRERQDFGRGAFQSLSSINRNRRETSRDVAAGVRRRRLQSGFSPDGKQLGFVRVISAVVGEVYLVSVNGGEPKRLTFNGAGVSNAGLDSERARDRLCVPAWRQEPPVQEFRLKAAAAEWLAATGSKLITRPSLAMEAGWPGAEHE